MHRRDWTTPAAILLPLFTVAAYVVVTVIGLLWPERPWVAIASSITVSVILWLVSALWFAARTRWYRVIPMLGFAVALVFPMVGAASLGTDLALERQGEQVVGEVVDIEVEQTNHREGRESWRTTYTFVSPDDGQQLGTVDYRGDKDAYDLDVGDRTDLIVDPDGELPVKLAERVDSSLDMVMLGLGGFLYLVGWGIGLVWPMLRRAVS